MANEVSVYQNARQSFSGVAKYSVSLATDGQFPAGLATEQVFVNTFLLCVAWRTNYSQDS